MKKLLLLIFIILITGCNKKCITVQNPLSIYFNENKIVENDYKSITDFISTLNFYCGKEEKWNNENILTITTNNKLYKFNISSNYYMSYNENNNYCYATNTSSIKELINMLNTDINNYQDTSYFKIRNEYKYQINESDSLIKLDKKDNYIIISSTYPLYNFKINQIKYKNDTTYIESDLLYSIEVIENEIDVVIRKEILDIPNFKISFDNKYGYRINILPFINKNKEINFLTKVQNKSS